MTTLERVLTRLGKKHIRLLEILSRGKIDAVASNKLSHVTRLLFDLQIIETDLFGTGLSERGHAVISTFRENICLNSNTSTGELLETLLPKQKIGKELRKKDLQFLVFLSAGPRPLDEIRHVKTILPLLESKQLVTKFEGLVQLTDYGTQKLSQSHENYDVETVTKYFLSVPKIVASQRSAIREDEFLKLHGQGLTLKEIGSRYGLTRQRVDQILKASPKFSEHLDHLRKRKEDVERDREHEKRLKKLERSLANQFPDQVDRLWDTDKNIGLDPTEITFKSASVPIWWKCPIDGHSWERTPSQITSSWVRSETSGCPKCAGKLTPAVKQASLIEEYPEFINKYWNWDRNNEIGADPTKITLASNRHVWLRCAVHDHEWGTKVHACVRQQWARGRSGCRVCSGTYNRRTSHWGKASPIGEKFPEQVEIYWDYGANSANGLDPKVITAGSSKIAHFVCPIDDYHWTATIAGISNSWSRGNSGCPACRGLATTPELSLQGLYPSYVEDYWDFERNSERNLDPQKITPSSKECAHFICVEHSAAWREPIRSITKGYWANGRNGCPTCCPRRRAKKKKHDSTIDSPSSVEVFKPGISDLLELLGYSTGKPRQVRHEILSLAYEIELSQTGSISWGQPISATRRLKILDELNFKRDAATNPENEGDADKLLRDISFVKSEFF